jgi:hypothetical protein
MTVQGAVPFVQTVFPDQVGGGFPGVIFSGPDASYNNVTRSFGNEGVVFCGRAVTKETDQDFSNNDNPLFEPYTVKNPTDSDVIADLVGVVTRPTFGVTQNFQDTAATQATPDGIDKAGFGDRQVVPVVLFGSKVRIWVRQDAAILDVTHGDPVYVMIDAANSFGLAVGEFARAEPANAAHALLVPNAIWFLSKTTRDNTLDPTNIIELL